MRIPVNGIIKENEYGFMVRLGNRWQVTDANNVLITELNPSEEYSKLGRDKYRLLGLADGSCRVIRFADLHRHSDNSLQDGMTKVKDMVSRTEYAGALTDHGNMYGFLEYYKGMNKAGKKPILGFEGYMEGIDGSLTRRHVILLAKNNTGYKNLLKLTSESFNHFKMKPHVTWEMLEKYHEGIICLSACLAGLIPTALKDGNMDLARAITQRYINIFSKEDFYIEIQRHHIDEEDRIRPMLVQLANEYGLKIVATTDSHYPTPDDREAHDVLLCLQTEKTINDEKRMRYNGDGYFLHTSEDMEELFAEFPEALDNTLEIADKCDVTIKLGDVNLPNYDFPPPFKDADDYMLHIAKEGFKARFAGTSMEHDQTYIDRFEYEVKMIQKMGFCAYFIIVWDFINWAKSNNIYVGPGRGSAAGSMVAYCMGITDLDPIKYNLLFERFLNPERISYPDIDTDIEHVGRPKVIQYMIQKYGADHVCRIVTFGTFAARQSIKDVARVFEHPASYGAKLASMVPDGVGMTIQKALEESVELQRTYANDETARKIIDVAKKIEGGKRHASQHACGLCVAPSAVSDYLPTSMEVDDETGEKALTSQVIMTEVEELSLIKMDLLGLKNMSVIHEVIDSVIANYGKEKILEQIHSPHKELQYQDIPLNDRETYKMLARGLTGGVFQMESPGMTRVITQMLEDIDSIPDDRVEQECFERLIAAVALYRPGPMDYIADYIDGMKNPTNIHYDCVEEETILQTTYGVLVYQEQLMRITQQLAGYTLGAADILRKACSKKKKDMMEKEHTKFVNGNKDEFDKGNAKSFIPGCVSNGIPRNIAEEIWQKIIKFASYAFNRSHAACYAWIVYLTAYMSCHWPAEFYAAMLNAFIENSDKVKVYLGQANSRNIPLLLPNIQKSVCQFSSHENSILFGLQGISGLKAMAACIVNERQANGDYKDLQDLYERLADKNEKLNKKCIEGLIYSGALNTFSPNKGALLEQYKLIESNYKFDAVNRELGQISLFGKACERIAMPDVNSLSQEFLLFKEQEVLGMFVSNHPMDFYVDKLKEHIEITPLENIVQMDTPMRFIKTVGLVHNIRRFFTKQGQEMASFIVETKYASMSCVIFPNNMETCKPFLRENEVFSLECSLVKDSRNDSLQLSVRTILTPEYMLTSKKEAIRVLILNRMEQETVRRFIHSHPGDTPVILMAAGREFPINPKVNMDGIAEAFFNTYNCRQPPPSFE